MSTARRLDAIQSVYPLTPIQEGMLIHTLAAPSSGIGFQQLRATLTQTLDSDAFVAAWQALARRHPIFRTGFAWTNVKQPLQIVQHTATIPVTVLDWRHLAAARFDSELEALLAADAANGFEMTRAPLARILAVRRTDESFAFVFSYHHILLDGWSLAQSLSEVFLDYRELCAGRSVKERVGHPYRDYVSWLQRRPLDEATAFWKEALAGFEGRNQLAFDAGRQPGLQSNDDVVALKRELDSTTAEHLLAAARRAQLTFGTLVYGAWALLLAHLSASKDIVFATTVSGRPAGLAHCAEIVGLFINNVPLRVRVNDESSVLELLRGILLTLACSNEHEHLPMVRIKECSAVAPGDVLADTLVVIENYPLGGLLREVTNGSVRAVQGSVRTSYPMTLVALTQVSGVTLQLVYDRRRVAERAASWTLERAAELIPRLAAALDEPVGSLSSTLPPLPPELVAAQRTPQRVELVPPSDPFEAKVLDTLKQLTGVQKIGMQHDLLEVCGSSLALVTLVTRLHSHFETRLSLAELAADSSVAHLSELLRGGTRSFSLVVPIQRHGKRTPLFCVHPSGGEVFCYRALARALGNDRPFLGIQAKGLDETGTVAEETHTIEELAAHYHAAIRKEQPQGPYFLAGWSLGGSLAFEIGRQFRERGERVAFLGMIDTRPKESFQPAPEQPDEPARLLSSFVWIAALAAGVPGSLELAREVAKRRTVAELLTVIREAGILPADMPSARAQRYFALWRSHLRAVRAYDAGPIDCRVTLFRAAEAPPAELCTALGLDPDPDRMLQGWRTRCGDRLIVTEIPGNHYNAVVPPHASALAGALRRALEEADANL